METLVFAEFRRQRAQGGRALGGAGEEGEAWVLHPPPHCAYRLCALVGLPDEAEAEHRTQKQDSQLHLHVR